MREQLAFELERFAWDEDGCLELVGTWRGLRGGRIAGPQLVLHTDDGHVRAPAVRHDRRPGADGRWSAAFRAPPGVGPVSGAELDLGRSLILTLPPPDPSDGAPPPAPVFGRTAGGTTGEGVGASDPDDRARRTGQPEPSDRAGAAEGADRARRTGRPEPSDRAGAAEPLVPDDRPRGRGSAGVGNLDARTDPSASGDAGELARLRAENERLARGLEQLIPDSQKLARDTERLLADNERLAREAEQAELARAQMEQAWGAARVEAQAARTADRQAVERQLAAEREAAAEAREALDAAVQARVAAEEELAAAVQARATAEEELAAARDARAVPEQRLPAAGADREHADSEAARREDAAMAALRDEIQALAGARDRALEAAEGSRLQAAERETELERERQRAGPVREELERLRGIVDRGEAELAHLRSELAALRAGSERGSGDGPVDSSRAGDDAPESQPDADAAETARLPVRDDEDYGDHAGGPPQTIAGGDRASTARTAPWSAPGDRSPGPGLPPRHRADEQAGADDDPTEGDAAPSGRRAEPLWNSADSRRRRPADHGSGAAPLPPVPRHADVYEPRPRWPLRVLVLGSAGLLLLALYLLIDGMA